MALTAGVGRMFGTICCAEPPRSMALDLVDEIAALKARLKRIGAL